MQLGAQPRVAGRRDVVLACRRAAAGSVEPSSSSSVASLSFVKALFMQPFSRASLRSAQTQNARG